MQCKSFSGEMGVGRSAGFSLVELMIALVIGLLITLGAFQVFVTTKKTFVHSAAVAERQESLRFLVDMLSYDIRSAAYTDLVDGDGIPLSTTDTLALSLDKENTVCGGDKYSVIYSQNGGSIFYEVSCDGGATTADSIVLGVGDISFTYFESGLGVNVTVTMVDDQGRLPEEEFVFRVANRSSVGRVLELWGGGA